MNPWAEKKRKIVDKKKKKKKDKSRKEKIHVTREKSRDLIYSFFCGEK